MDVWIDNDELDHDICAKNGDDNETVSRQLLDEHRVDIPNFQSLIPYPS